MQGWVFGKWNFSEQRWSGAIFYRAQCRDRRRFPRIWFLNCKKSSWHLTPLSFLSWFGLFVYSKKRKASDPASQPKASQIQKVPILKRPHDIFQDDNKIKVLNRKHSFQLFVVVSYTWLVLYQLVSPSIAHATPTLPSLRALDGDTRWYSCECLLL